MNFIQRILLLFALIIQSFSLQSQAQSSEGPVYYKVVSDPSEVAEIRRKCLLELRYWQDPKKPLPDTLSLSELKALLECEDPKETYLVFEKIREGKVKNIDEADAELVQLVYRCAEMMEAKFSNVIDAITIVDPKNSAQYIINLLKKDILRSDLRWDVKQTLGKTIPSQATIDYLKELLLLEERSIFEKSDKKFELQALIDLYKNGNAKQRTEISDFVMAYCGEKPEFERALANLKEQWSENPAPKFLGTMKADFIDDLDQYKDPNSALLGRILTFEGKRGEKYVESILPQLDEIYNKAPSYFEILKWAHTYKKQKVELEMLQRLADMYYTSITDKMDEMIEIGGIKMAYQYLACFKRSEGHDDYEKMLKLKYELIDNSHPMRRLADTLVELGFMDKQFSNRELEAIRNTNRDIYKYDYPYDVDGIYNFVQYLPSYFPVESQDYDKFLKNVLVPLTKGELEGLEYLEYADGYETYEWLFFQGKAYQFIDENLELSSQGWNYEGSNYDKFHSLNFLLKLNGSKNRFFKFPRENNRGFQGGFFTTPQKARIFWNLYEFGDLPSDD